MADDIVKRLRDEINKPWGSLLHKEAADEIERLRAEIERMTRERDCFSKDEDTALAQAKIFLIERNAANDRAEAAEQRVEKLREALKEIKCVPSVQHASGHLSDCAWCNGSARIASKVLAETENG